MTNKTDVILIGGGIMSATLGVLLKELKPELNITVFEKLDKPGLESSNAWNNAGTGHSALCELNYTKEDQDGNVDISKALDINEQFQLSKQLWAHLVNKGLLKDPHNFIMPVPHMSYVSGEDNVRFIKNRYKALSDNPLFRGMEITEDKEKMKQWVPLMMEGRDPDEVMALTRMDSGTDINFGQLTEDLFDVLQEQGVNIEYRHLVKDLNQVQGGGWQVKVYNEDKKKMEYHNADFVFIGAGGYSLPLLQKTNIPESKHIGGFPVSGLFLVCKDPAIVEKHHAKVYGKAKIGAPPMSVPHLDTRYIDGEQSLLFGPYAGFSPKFLKTGSYLDLFGSVKPNNLLTMLSAGAKELKLTQYLIEQVMQSKDQRIEELREFVPEAKAEDWDIVVAGQRVQVIKDTDQGKGTLQFGTEVITSQDGSVAALLGASPGASTAAHVMLEVVVRCFGSQIPNIEERLKKIIPSYGQKLGENEALFEQVNQEVSEALNLVPKK
ncbi:malate dehydrogenase (quinone) [Macrococcus carouselicus]|uniref:Probable malate:quinone oxidoreductase n=1 Tax=Macrococcus carouselicus TaxID=69969 RepID=A0A9Q8CD48_9STAP|nr:malate dehydrogenase (quinone) [Macrococcus carouselicus]TDL96606.1 malate dehydrogenase (quinone) [Macrococcus carouselicus]